MEIEAKPDENDETGTSKSKSGLSIEVEKSQPKKDIKDALSRMREKKAAELALTTVKGGDATPTNSSSANLSAAEKRKMLQKMRQQSRAAIEENEEDPSSNKRSSGRQGPRSPLKSQKSSVRKSKQGVFEEAEYDDNEDEDEDKEKEEKKPEEEEDADLLEIVHVEAPQQVFPLSFLPVWRHTENNMNPTIQLMPKPHPDLGPLCAATNVCMATSSNALCNCLSCYGDNQPRRGAQSIKKGDVFNERDFLQSNTHLSGSTDDLDRHRWVTQQKITSDKLLKLSKQYNKFQREVDRLAEEQEEVDEESGLLQQDDSDKPHRSSNKKNLIYAENGMYISNPPILSHILLHGETVQLPIVSMSAADINLSRATQRTLRELQGSLEEEKIRRYWAKLNKTPPQNIENSSRAAESEAEGMPVGAEAEATGEGADGKDEPEEALRNHFPPQMNLLKNVSNAPMLRVIENPLDTSFAQPVIPDVNISYGGQLGQWPYDASADDRSGPLPIGWNGVSKRGGAGNATQRAILRLHVHQMVLSDHVMMSAEERRLVDLKVSYAQYRALFEQKTLEFLMTKLTALIEQTTKVYTVMSKSPVHSAHDLLHLKRLYSDLTETLPALNELNVAVDNLTMGIYEGWRELVEIRRRYGVVNTGAALTARKIRSNLQLGGDDQRSHRSRRASDHIASEGDENVDIEDSRNNIDTSRDQGVDANDAIWRNLRDQLTSVPTLLEAIQGLLYRDVLSPPQQKSAHTSVQGSADDLQLSPSGASLLSIVAEDQKERALSLQTKLTRVLTIVQQSIDELQSAHGLIPLVALRLTEDGVVTPDNQLSVVEMKRRAHLSACKYKVVVRVNGKVVTSTEWMKLKVSSLSVDYKKYFEFRLFHQPQDITLDIYASKVHVLDPLETLVASVSVPVPGLSHRDTAGSRQRQQQSGGKQNVTHSYTPILGWYSFAADLKASAPSFSNHLFSGMFAASDAAASSNVAGEYQLARRTEGAILCTTEYDVSAVDHSAAHHEGLRSEEAALIPHVKHSAHSVMHRSHTATGTATGHQGGSSGAAMDGKTSDFTRENDFQALLPDLDDLDLNDPANDHLLYLKSKKSVVGDEDVFRLTGLDYSVAFSVDNVSYANYVKLKECSRMKLLRLRTLKPYLFSDPIPLSEAAIKNSEVFKKIFNKEFELSAGLEEQEEGAQLVGGKDSANLGKVNNFLARVRNSQTALHRNKRKKKLATSSVVIETNYLLMEELEIDVLLERRRTLRPKVKVRAPVSIQIDSCELLVQVVGARNIPLRSEFEYSDVDAANKRLSSTSAKRRPRRDGGAGSESEGEGLGQSSDADNLLTRGRSASGAVTTEQPIVSDHMLDERKLKEKRRAKTFVEVRFQENIIATTAYDGGTPMWKQSIALPFRPPQDDFSPSNLDQLREDVHFTLFDEVYEDDAERGGFLEGETTTRVEKRYLGSFSVPFTTLYHEGRIEGVFRMETPAINFGYDHTSSFATRRKAVNDGTMFVHEEVDALPSARGGAPDANPIHVTGLFSGMYWLLDCLVRTANSRATAPPKKSLSDSLYYNGSYMHSDTMSELSYFATDDKSTYIKLLLTFDPILVTAPVVEDDITTTTVVRDDRYLVHYSREWQVSIHAIGPHTQSRKYKLFGTNSSGLNTLVCRFLSPQKPPAGFESRRGVLHLTSMIPFMKDAQSFIGEMDLWCTTKQFWEIGAGDEEEHATMLYNYLYYLSIASGENRGVVPSGDNKGARKKELGYPSDEAIRNESVFLVLGKAIPEGETTYILVRDTRRKGQPHNPENYLIINPCNGFVYSAIDPNCPLREIHCIATPYNLWGNIQVETQPCEMKFDVFNVDQWRPFFGARLKPPTGGLHTVQGDIEYKDCSPGYALDVEKSVYTALRNSIRRWRSKRHRSTTTFHPDACSVMHELLPSLEQWKRSGSLADDAPRSGVVDRSSSKGNTGGDYNSALERLQAEARDKMKTLLRTRTLKGCPLNLPFTDVDEIVAKIKTLCMHEAQHPEVQFVMAVRAFPLYNNILSLWIFIGTLENK